MFTLKGINKAPGYDNMPISVIKDCLQYTLQTITGIINHSFTFLIFPRAWKKGEVVFTLKMGIAKFKIIIGLSLFCLCSPKELRESP